MAGVISFTVQSGAKLLPQAINAAHPLPVTASASAPMPVILGNRTPKGYQQIVGLAASTALTVPAGALVAVITTEGQNVRWRDDGTAPTAAIGFNLNVGQALFYDGSLAALKFIQQAATATLNISYYA